MPFSQSFSGNQKRLYKFPLLFVLVTTGRPKCAHNRDANLTKPKLQASSCKPEIAHSDLICLSTIVKAEWLLCFVIHSDGVDCRRPHDHSLTSADQHCQQKRELSLKLTMTIGDGASPRNVFSDGRNSGLASSDGLGGTEPVSVHPLLRPV